MKTEELFENKEIPDELVQQLEQRAEDERNAGGNIEIDPMLPTISVTMSNGAEYFFQEHAADYLLNEVPDNIQPEDFILAIAQNW